MIADIKFVKRSGTYTRYYQEHLRWVVYRSSTEVLLAYSAESVLLRGQNLGPLLAEILGGRVRVVAEEEPRSASPAQALVTAIQFVAH